MFVYLGQVGDLIKVGITASLSSRQANYKSHNPHFNLIFSKEVADRKTALRIENEFKSAFSSAIASGNEWFKIGKDQAITKLNELLANKGVTGYFGLIEAHRKLDSFPSLRYQIIYQFSEWPINATGRCDY